MTPTPIETAPARTVAGAAEPFDSIETADLDPLLERIGEARLVLIGEASHGTSEFYRMRARITQELIARRGFRIVAIEADWPDAAQLDRWVHGSIPDRQDRPFTRFPAWMWRNREVLAFTRWLREWNRSEEGPPAGIYGLDLYSLQASIAEVVSFLDRVDPALAATAREHYSCLSPYVQEPQAYGYAALSDRYLACEDDVLEVLTKLRERSETLVAADGRSYLDAEQNARVAAGAERYYRAMFHGGPESWNLRDTHMYETLESLLAFHGRTSRAVVWAHNSHLGDARATEMGDRGELDVGQLVREQFGDAAYLIGQGTDHGTVAAAAAWDEPVRIQDVRPSRPDSHERVCHATGVASFLLPVGRRVASAEVVELMRPRRLERAIGVVYRPATERWSHYFEASVSNQFDEWIWFDESHALEPLPDAWQGEPDSEPHPYAVVDA
jgi:erythromycin esterase-like protein